MSILFVGDKPDFFVRPAMRSKPVTPFLTGMNWQHFSNLHKFLLNKFSSLRISPSQQYTVEWTFTGEKKETGIVADGWCGGTRTGGSGTVDRGETLSKPGPTDCLLSHLTKEVKSNNKYFYHTKLL